MTAPVTATQALKSLPFTGAARAASGDDDTGSGFGQVLASASLAADRSAHDRPRDAARHAGTPERKPGPAGTPLAEPGKEEAMPCDEDVCVMPWGETPVPDETADLAPYGGLVAGPDQPIRVPPGTPAPPTTTPGPKDLRQLDPVDKPDPGHGDAALHKRLPIRVPVPREMQLAEPAPSHPETGPPALPPAWTAAVVPLADAADAVAHPGAAAAAADNAPAAATLPVQTAAQAQALAPDTRPQGPPGGSVPVAVSRTGTAGTDRGARPVGSGAAAQAMAQHPKRVETKAGGSTGPATPPQVGTAAAEANAKDPSVRSLFGAQWSNLPAPASASASASAATATAAAAVAPAAAAVTPGDGMSHTPTHGTAALLASAADPRREPLQRTGAAASAEGFAATFAAAGITGPGASGAEPATAPLPEARLPLGPGHPGFAAAMGAQVSLFVRDGVHTARLHLNPAELGPITVQIALEGASARVHLAAEHALTRQALEQAMPTLAGSLRDSGLTLTGGGVSEQPRETPGQPGGAGADDGTRRGTDAERAAAASGVAGAARDETAARALRPLVQRGLVDLVA